MLPSPAKFLLKNFDFGDIFYFSTMVALNVILKHITKQELPLSNGLESFFHELGVVCCSQELKRQVSGVTSRPIFQWCSNSKLYFCRCLADRLYSWYPCRGIVYQQAQQVR